MTNEMLETKNRNVKKSILIGSIAAAVILPVAIVAAKRQSCADLRLENFTFRRKEK